MSAGIAGVPLQNVAVPLRDTWVRFHQSNLCLGIEALFVFQPKGMEVWCRVSDERGYQRFSEGLNPLRKDFLIELYPNYVDHERKSYSPDDDDPPVSFWTNAELRVYMRDPNFGRALLYDDESPTPASQDPELKRRLKLYGDDVMSQADRMDRLAGHLPALAEAAFGENLMPDIRGHARDVSMAHARELGKCAAKLAEYLSHALPRGTDKAGPSPIPPQLPPPVSSRDGALSLSVQGEAMAHRIVDFVYPQAHTVDLTDLKRPSLIEDLKSLQKSSDAFIAVAQKAK